MGKEDTAQELREAKLSIQLDIFKKLNILKILYIMEKVKHVQKENHIKKMPIT